MNDNVQALVKIWRELISSDHHKSKDHYFEITKAWKAGHEYPVFSAQHNAYIGDDLFSPDCKTYEEAEEYLINHLLTQIQKQHEWAQSVLALPEEDRSWSEREASFMIEVLAKNAETIKRITDEQD